MLAVIAAIDFLLAMLPKARVGVEEGQKFYNAARDIFGSEELPSLTAAEIAAKMGVQFQANLDDAQAELNRLNEA